MLLAEKQVFKTRRQCFQKKMKEGSVAFFFSANLLKRNNDINYPFRQNSDFFYLTNLNEESSVLVLQTQSELLYLSSRDIEKEIWDGPRLGLARAKKDLGFDKTKDIKTFWDDLDSITKNTSVSYYEFGLDAERDNRIFFAIRKNANRSRKAPFGIEQIISPRSILHEMRVIKSSEEIKILKESIEITRRGHISLMENTRSGMNEYELEAILEYEFRRVNAVQAYPPIVASGANACILHYIRNDSQLQAGDLLLVDAGAEKEYMAADVTRTFPISKRFSPIQKEVYEFVLRAQEQAIAKSEISKTLEDVHDAATFALIEALVALKVLKGNPINIFAEAKEIEEEGNLKKIKSIPYRRYFMHRTSHWLGMDVHDVGSYYHNAKARPLEAGMVFTVEPGLYFPLNDDTIPDNLRGMGIRIEDDVLIQEKKPIVLSAAIPKLVEELELFARG